LKNILLATIALFVVIGCTPSGPTKSDVTINDRNPVTDQRIFAQINFLTDNPPITYQWTATGGALDIPDITPFSTYWTVPSVPGTYSLTCAITDKEKKKAAYTFTIAVRERSLQSNLVEANKVVLSITKESEYKTGGVWVSIKDNKLKFINSQINEDSIWSKNFITMLNRTDPDTLLYTLWGVETTGRNILELTSSTETTLVCSTCYNTDTINTMARDVTNTSILWVGTDSGLNYYDPSTTTWTNYLLAQVNDLSEGPDYVYAATNNGVFRTDGKTIYGGDTCAVLAVASGTATNAATDVWSVVQGVVQKNGKQLDAQPSVVVCSLDVDPSGKIWCGKSWWDGSQWHVVPGLESVQIVKSVASTEGLIYFLSDSGVLYRW